MIFNKTKHAIKILNEKKEKLDDIQNTLEGNTWKASLKASLILYLGKDSVIVGRLENLFFTKKLATGTSYMGGAKSENVYDDTKKANFKDLIDNSIQHIESHGLYKNPLKNNFLSEFNNVQIIGGLFIASGIIFSAGNYKGNLDSERLIDKISNEKASLQKKYDDAIKANQKLKVKNDSLRK